MDWKIMSQIRLRKHFDTVKKAMTQIGKKKKELSQNFVSKCHAQYRKKWDLLFQETCFIKEWIDGGGELDKNWREEEVIGGQGNKGER